MNSEVKAKWLEALRSGEYGQARYALRPCDNGFCCLGVLSDIYRKEVGGSWEWNYSEDSAYSYSIVPEDREDFGTVEPPACVAEWADLGERNPHVHVGDREFSNYEFVTLSELNDEGKTFNEIADLIEKQL